MTDSPRQSTYLTLARRLDALDEQGQLRRLTTASARDGQWIEIDGRRLLNLSSNDYLGYGAEGGAIAAFHRECNASNAVDRFGSAGSASRLMSGNHALYDELETTLAEAYGHGTESLVFGSGYHANLGILPALVGRNDLVLSDRANHASILDGIRLSGARWRRYRHRDCGHLRELLRKERPRHSVIVIVTESVFSMDGDVADLAELVRLRDEFDALLYVDEAHAVGVRGTRGLGVAEEAGCLGGIDVLVGTFGKALASLGAYGVFAPVVKQALINFARTLIFTTALPPVVVHASLRSFQRMLGATDERRHLADLATRFHDALHTAGLRTASARGRGDGNHHSDDAGNAAHGQQRPAWPASPIVPIIVGENEAAVRWADALRDRGALAMAIRPPTVPAGTARLRCSLCANMKWSDLVPVVRFLSEKPGPGVA